jgi:hypothetical protein
MKVAAISLLSAVFLAISGTTVLAQDSGSDYYREVIGDWTLLTVPGSDGETRCLVGTASNDGELRTSYITRSDLLFDIRLTNVSIPDGIYRISLQVDNNTPVSFDRAIVDAGRILIRVETSPENLALLAGIIAGNELVLLSNLMDPAALFSLGGSTAALTWLRDCSREVE